MFRAWFGRASRCTLRMKSCTHRGELFVHQDTRYARNRELRIKVNHSCNKLHATKVQFF